MSTVLFELPYCDNPVWTGFTSEKTEVEEFEVFVAGEFCDRISTFELRSVVIHCSPLQNKNCCIWNCEFGPLKCVGYDGARRARRRCIPPELTCFQNAPGGCFYNFDGPQSTVVKFPSASSTATHRFLFNLATDTVDLSALREAGNKQFQVNVEFEVEKSTLIDLSTPNNKLIESPEDAAQVDVEGEKLWLPKSLLSSKSPFFHALFNGDFLEKRTGEFVLREIQLSEFIRFFAALCGYPVTIDDHSVEYLFKLADYFQCDAVNNLCGDFLRECFSLHRQHSFCELPVERILILADRYYRSCEFISVLLEYMTAAQIRNVLQSDMTEMTLDIARQWLPRKKRTEAKERMFPVPELLGSPQSLLSSLIYQTLRIFRTRRLLPTLRADRLSCSR